MSRMMKLPASLKGGIGVVCALLLMLVAVDTPVMAQEETPMQQQEEVDITDGEILDLFITLNDAEVQTSEILAEGERVPTGGQEERQQEVPPRQEEPPREDTLTTTQERDTLAAEQTGEGQAQQWNRHFNQWDEDRDGRLSEDEFQSGFSESVFSDRAQTENASQQFDEWDEDGNGYLSQEEFRSGLSEIQGVERMGEQMGEQQTPPRGETEDPPQRAETGGEMSPVQLFNQWDEDGDGSLGQDEFESGFSESPLSDHPQAEDASQHFDEWDEDGNGELSQEELRSGISELRGNQQQMGEQMGEKQTPPRGEAEEDMPPRAETGGDQPPTQQQAGASANEVQEFAQRMVDEHSQVIDQAEQLANRLDIQREDNLASKVMKNSVQGLVEQLQDAGGMATMGGDEPAETQQQQQEMGQQGEMEGQLSDQEREYMMAQVSLHQQALLLLDNTLIPNTDESELQQMLEQERETIKQHLEEAKQILSGQSQSGSMGGSGSMNN